MEEHSTSWVVALESVIVKLKTFSSKEWPKSSLEIGINDLKYMKNTCVDRIQ